MMGPGPGQYQPRAPVGVVELNIGDQWRAKWVDAEELPDGAPVAFAYAVVYGKDRGYVTRPRGSSDPWRVVEGAVESGETAEDFVKRHALARMGITVGHMEMVGFLECKATKFNTEYPIGSVTVRPIYVAVASSVEDVPDDSGWERRRMRLNEHSKEVRARYPEIDEYMVKAMQRYMVLQALGKG